MKVLLRDLNTGCFYAGQGQWIADPGGAVGFEDTGRAIDLVCDEALDRVEIVMRFENPEFEIPLTIAGTGSVEKVEATGRSAVAVNGRLHEPTVPPTVAE